MPPLIHLLSNGSPLGREEAAAALSNVAIHRANQKMVANQLGVEGEWTTPEGSWQVIVDETMRRSIDLKPATPVSAPAQAEATLAEAAPAEAEGAPTSE